jgi:proline dehydrogenase
MSWLDRAASFALPAVPKPIVRLFSRRYIAGASMEDAFRTVRELSRGGAMATLDILGEFCSTLEEARQNTAEHEHLIRRIAEEGLGDTYISLKLTALGLLIDRTVCLDHMRHLLRCASQAGNFLRIDMEDSSCTAATLDVYETLRREFPGRIGAVLQARLRRTMQDADRLTREPANVRLCKGIYLEPRSIAYTDAEIIRRNFTLVLARLIERKAYPAIATHDEVLVWEALRLIGEHALQPDRYEFQMLLGVDEALRRILIDAGHRVRVYVPYGRHWYRYSVRRLRENPQIAGHALRAIFQRTPIP